MQIEVSHESSASPATVWAIATDLARSVDVLSTITAIERLDDGEGFDVGTRWRESRVLFGREAAEVLEVTAIDEAGRSYVVEADNRGTHYVSALGVSGTTTGSRLWMTLGAEASTRRERLLARTVGRAFEGATRSALEQDLRDIAAAAEADDAAAADGAAGADGSDGSAGSGDPLDA